MDNEGCCYICHKSTTKKCASCKVIYYCSMECQKTDWKNHKKTCRDFELQRVGNMENKMDDSLYINVSDGKGLGIFTKRDIKYGEILILDKPLIVWDHPHISLSRRQSENKFIEELADEKLFAEKFSKLSKSEQAKLMLLQDRMHPNSEKSVFGIFYSNYIVVDEAKTKGVLFVNFARLNHSCLPNVFHEFVKGYGRVYAIKDIRKGEELCYSYEGIFKNRLDRQSIFQKGYSFTCSCELCVNNSDKYRNIETARIRFKELEEELVVKVDPSNLSMIKNNLEEQYTMLNQGDLMQPTLRANHAILSLKIAILMGRSNEAKEHAKIAHEMLVIRFGIDHADTIDYAKYLRGDLTGKELLRTQKH